MAELRTEAASAADQSPVEHDARPEARAGREDDQGANAAVRAEAPLRERERVDVVVDEGRQREARAQRCGERDARELGHVVRFLTDDARRRVHDRRHAHADTDDLARAGATAQLVEQRLDRRLRSPGACRVRRHLALEHDVAVRGDDTCRGRGSSDIDRENRPRVRGAGRAGRAPAALERVLAFRANERGRRPPRPPGPPRARARHSARKSQSVMPSAWAAARAAGEPSAASSISRWRP